MKLTKDKEQEHLQAQDNMARLDNYYDWSLSFLGSDFGKRIWDASGGVGLLADKIKHRCDFLLLSEFGEENLNILQEKYRDKDNIMVQYCDLENSPSKEFIEHKIDTVILLDVLEHIGKPVTGLRLIRDSLTPGGHLLIKVPAHQFLFCNIDEASLHYRRYSKKLLKEQLEEAGFHVKKLQYMNMPGALLYFVKGKLLKKETNFSNTIDSGNLSLMNKVIPLIRSTEKILPVLFGLSVIAVAQKR